MGFPASVGVFKCLDIKYQEKSKPCDPLKPGAAPLGGARLLASQVSLSIPDCSSQGSRCSVTPSGSSGQLGSSPGFGSRIRIHFISPPKESNPHERLPHIPPNHAALDKPLTFLSLYFLLCNRTILGPITHSTVCNCMQYPRKSQKVCSKRPSRATLHGNGKNPNPKSSIAEVW